MNIYKEQQIFSSGILRLVGYGLLLMASIDFLFLLIPLQLMNPSWEFQTLGAMIERIPVTLLAMVLIFYGERDTRAPVESYVLKYLSRLCLVVSIVLILSIPLSITNSFRIYNQHNAEINVSLVNQADAAKKLKNNLQSSNTSTEISTALQKQTGKKIIIPDSVDAKKLKTEILDNLQVSQQQLLDRAQTSRAEKRFILRKNCIKWNLGAAIASILFFMLWKSTLWARLEKNQS